MNSETFFQMHPVFTREEYAASRPDSSQRTVDSLLRTHAASGRVVRVRRGIYATNAPGRGSGAADPFLIATKAAPDAVISHHAALQFHGCSYSIWSQVTFLTAHAARPFAFGPNDFVPVRPPEAVAALPAMGGGIERRATDSGEVLVCSCERAMVDLMHTPALGGGWEEIFRSLFMVDYFDLEAVISYALALDSALTAARVGYFLSQHRERLFVEESHLARLAAAAPQQARYFDRTREPGRLVRPWNLIVPDRFLDARWAEET